MKLRERMLKSRLFLISLAAVLGSMIIVSIVIIVIIGRNAYEKMPINSICPDYFTYEYAYVVDEKGRGIDSVPVVLRDNSNIHLVYRTFTDSNGRFVLFHDLGSFTLPKIPLSYFLYVSFDGLNDTVRYSFERNRFCHFRKIDGPDTIVCDRSTASALTLQLEQSGRVVIDTGYGFAPYGEIGLSRQLPKGLAAGLPFDTVLYTTIPIGGSSILFAVVPVNDFRVLRGKMVLLTEGTYYAIDRDGDRNLGDELLLLFAGAGERRKGGIFDCTVRTCHTVDSVRIADTWYLLDLQLRGMERKQPLLRFRRADARKGTIMLTSNRTAVDGAVDSTNKNRTGSNAETVVDSVTYTILLWDYRGADYADLSTVVLGIDRDGDGVFDSREGSREMYEHARGKIVLDNMSLVIDTIAPDGLRLFCSGIKKESEKPAEAMTGTWTGDFHATATCPVSLYRECDAHRYVVLYFFEGFAASFMDAPEINAFISLMRDRLGSTRIIGINRKSTGELYDKEPVINENRGWHGPLVRQFHNYRQTEIVCLDTTATIVYRGAIGTEAIAAVWKHAGVDDAAAILSYERLYADREVWQTQSPPGPDPSTGSGTAPTETGK